MSDLTYHDICDIFVTHRTTCQSVKDAGGSGEYVFFITVSQTSDISVSRTFETSSKKKSVAALSQMTTIQIELFP